MLGFHESITLPALQKNFVNIFFVFAWEVCIEKWRGFLVNFFWSPSPTKRSATNSGKIREKFGAKFGTKYRKIRGTFVLQLSCRRAPNLPNLHPPPRVGPPLGSLPRGGANLGRFVPVRSLQTRASGREFVHVCFGLLGPLMQVGANSDGFGALWSWPKKAGKATVHWQPRGRSCGCCRGRCRGCSQSRFRPLCAAPSLSKTDSFPPHSLRQLPLPQSETPRCP